MALLRLLYFPSATSVSAKQQSTATLSSKKPPQSTDLKASFLSCSTFSMSSFSVSHTCAIETRRRTGLFVLRISSSTQSPVPSSSSSASSAVTVENHEALNPVVESEPEAISRTRLCAANIPWTSTPEDIRALFEKHGTVLDVELSMYNKTRNRGLAFITMGSADEALAALSNLESYDVDGRALKVNYAKPQKKKPPPSVPPKPISRHDLFVANLPYEARGKDLREFFDSGKDNIVSAEVVFHGNPGRCSGYGFVSFSSKATAEAALAAFEGKDFMGRPIRVAHSRRFSKKSKVSVQAEDKSSESEPCC